MGDVPTWVAAIAAWASLIVTSFGIFVTCFMSLSTWIALGIGFTQINDERNARKKAEEEKLRNERRNQAEHIAAWISEKSGTMVTEITVHNQSLQPIYNLVISITDLYNKNKESCQIISISIPPGYSYISTAVGITDEAVIETAFKDIKGVSWLRRKNGELLEIKNSPLKYYNITDEETQWSDISNESNRERSKRITEQQEAIKKRWERK
jgi:hypothetical protein